MQYAYHFSCVYDIAVYYFVEMVYLIIAKTVKITEPRFIYVCLEVTLPGVSVSRLLSCLRIPHQCPSVMLVFVYKYVVKTSTHYFLNVYLYFGLAYSLPCIRVAIPGHPVYSQKSSQQLNRTFLNYSQCRLIYMQCFCSKVSLCPSVCIDYDTQISERFNLSQARLFSHNGLCFPCIVLY